MVKATSVIMITTVLAIVVTNLSPNRELSLDANLLPYQMDESCRGYKDLGLGFRVLLGRLLERGF